MVLGLRFAAPRGRHRRCPPLPASAAGPGLRQLLVGSEGTLGVISELALRVRPAPRERVYEGVFFEDFAAGVRRRCGRSPSEHALPDVARLSDEHETRMSLALAGAGRRQGPARSRLPRRCAATARACLAILGFEGAPEEVAARRKRALELLRAAAAGWRSGARPGEAWLKGRFSAPYLRDELLTHGVMVETLETATQWSNLRALHRAVGAAIADALDACGTPGLVMCHVSHLYETRRLAVLHVPRAPARGRGDRAVARGQASRERGDR